MSIATARIFAMNEVDQEIAERKARLDLLKREHAARNGVAHPDKAGPLPPADLNEALPEGASAEHKARAEKAVIIQPSEQKLLDAAAKLWQPGVVAWPARLADEMGIRRTRVSVMITSLCKKGAWPYAPCGQGQRVQDAEYPALRARAAGEAPTPRRSTTRPTTPKVAKPSEPETSKVAEPYPGYVPNTDPKADPELLVIQRVLAQLARLPTAWSRQRVMAYLIDRMTEEEGNEP